ncbi:sigma-70 family RNA polymerase sigma factor [Terrimonas sp. NA20]|uniref:Sigma-70 family RNA polymerase sigma factor n=1 Tax=Terrimonas ginsenosidimutans TaxID=2908004 RepID=A0ABS9KRM2_9BACT|nr:sigma-70 family RNA polymerase sigma factor [Terrimonas ginsenosidimutans]MCG2614953.1 sigma-70 family RNA polymerase sigma factor [Terrimonas ginsenosidimutans]
MENEFTELVNQHRMLIFKVCNLYCPDQEGRKDLFQEIVLQLWKSYPAFRQEAANTTWIYRIALNTAISNFRKESKRPVNKELSSLAVEIPDMAGNVGSQDDANILRFAIDKLTEVEKAVILFYLDERTYEEISAIMGISISNVGVRINRIKNKLSKIVKTQSNEY